MEQKKGSLLFKETRRVEFDPHMQQPCLNCGRLGVITGQCMIADEDNSIFCCLNCMWSFSRSAYESSLGSKTILQNSRYKEYQRTLRENRERRSRSKSGGREKEKKGILKPKGPTVLSSPTRADRDGTENEIRERNPRNAFHSSVQKRVDAEGKQTVVDKNEVHTENSVSFGMGEEVGEANNEKVELSQGHGTVDAARRRALDERQKKFMMQAMRNEIMIKKARLALRGVIAPPKSRRKGKEDIKKAAKDSRREGIGNGISNERDGDNERPYSDAMSDFLDSTFGFEQ